MNPKLIFIIISLNLFIVSLKCDKQNDSSDEELDSDYDYSNETDTTEGECPSNSIFDRFQEQHQKARTEPLVVNVETVDQTIDILKNLGNSFKSLVGLSKRDKHRLLEFITENDLGLSRECSAAYYRIYEALNNYDEWALKFVDSIGSFPPSGFVEGVFSDFGEYDECLAVQSPYNRRDPTIKGKYCVSKLILPFPLSNWNEEPNPTKLGTMVNMLGLSFFKDLSVDNLKKLLNIVNGTIFHLGICIPSVCDSYEVQDMLNKIIHPIIRMPLEVIPECQTIDQPLVLNNYQKISITILTVLAICVVFCTTIDLFGDKSPEMTTKTKKLIQCFSIIKNTKAMFTTTNKFPALDTLRLLLIFNVHVVHLYLFVPSLGLKTLKQYLTYVVPGLFNDWRYFWVKSPLMIDALFTLSGFLISYSLMKRLIHTHGRFNYFLYLFQNWLRFVIIVFGSILFYYVFPLLHSGPVWDTATDYLTKGCQNPFSLIKILLFIDNFQVLDYTKLDETCNVTLWFMSSLYQFIIISPILVILFYKNRRHGVYALILVLIITLFATIAPFLLFGTKSWLQRLSQGMTFICGDISDSLNWFHSTPNNHAFSYFIGICFGLLMHQNIVLNSFKVKLFWFLSITGISGVYYWNNSFWYTRDTEPQTSVLLWHTVGKAIYSSSFGWIYFCCCTERGGVLNKILSWKGFRPISRLSFGIYLLHYILVIRRIFHIKQTLVVNNRLMVANITIDIILDIVMGYVFYILIECPFSNIFQILFSRRPVKTTLPEELNNNKNNSHNMSIISSK